MDSSSSKSQADLSYFRREIYFAIAQFLSGGPCERAHKALVEELETHEIIPKRVSWLGESVPQDYQQYSSALSHVGSDHLPALLERLLHSVQKKENVKITSSRSLLSTQLLCPRIMQPDADRPPTLNELLGRNLTQPPIKTWGKGQPINPIQACLRRDIRGVGLGTEQITTNFYKDRIKISCRSVGHLSAVYCVLYDMTGRYIFTGADDKLVKVWSAVSGRLLATLRGATGEITDMAINNENTLLAVGTNDRLIRVWSLPNCASLAVLNAHGGNITSVFFCPMASSLCNVRYLASTSTDGSCAFWAYTEAPGEEAKFQVKPTLYQERMRPGHAQILCSSFSSGGVFMAAGSADNNVRVYYMLGNDGPTRILEVECHKERVDSISWAHKGLRFISGSRDGTALVYRFEYQQWRYTRIHCCKNLPGDPPVIIDDPKKRPRVTMVAWNTDDTFVLTATSDHLIKAWNPINGSLVRILKGHKDEIFILEPHPFNPRIVCSAGHDGLIAMWDIGLNDKRKDSDSYGKQIFEHTNDIEGLGHGSIFDCKFAPDGLGLAATDSHGHLLIFSVDNGKDSKFACLPKELFFHTDYRPFSSNSTTPQVLDEQTQIDTHLMPPPFLVDTEGNPYPPEIQRLVPGRESCKVDQLIPVVAVAPGGRREVIEGLPNNINNNNANNNNSSNRIDVMIARLAASNEAGGSRNENQPEGGSPNAPAGGARRNGDLDGMRQSNSTATWQPGTFFGYRKKIVVPPLPPGILKSSEDQRRIAGEEEEEYYQTHTKKSPSGNNIQPNPLISPTFSPSGRLNRVRRRRAEPVYFHQYHQDENNVLDEDEGIARPNPPQQEISVSQESPRRPLQRSNNNNQQQRQVGGARPARRVRYDVRRLLNEHGHESDPENVDNIPSSDDSDSESLEEMLSSSSESDEESDSDWGQGSKTTRDQDRDNQSSTKSKRQRNRNQSPSPSRSASRVSRKRFKKEIKSDSDDEPEDREPRPGPSSEINKSEATKSKSKKNRVVADVGGLDEIPEPFRPPEWLSEVMPKRSPYFPQLGDDLVYFRQGHALYVKHIEDNPDKFYIFDKKMKKALPYVQHPDLPPEMSVRVVHIKFELLPPRVVHLKLARTNWETGEPTGSYIFVKYHDVASLVDFLVLRQIFDKSLNHRWNTGDKFRCMMDKSWWLGTVKAKKPFNPEFPDSNFLSYDIEWDVDHDHENLSPWDMEIITDDFEVPENHNNSQGIPASPEELRNTLYEVRREDWEPHGHQDAECQRISNLVEGVMNLAISEAFSTPVDLNMYPDYAFSIEYLIDLSTIKARLDNLFYRRADAIVTDIEHIAINAEKFNQPEAEIVKHAKIIRDLLLEIVNNQQFRNVNEAYHRIAERYKNGEVKKCLKVRKPSIASSSNSSEPVAGPSTSKGSSSSFTSKLRKRIPKPRNRGGEKSSKSWQERCKDLLESVWSRPDAQPFRHPVNILEYPDYNQAIDTPMCLHAVKEDLRGGNYESPVEFNRDMMLIFANSRQYNTDPRSPIILMTLRLKSFYESHAKSILDDWKSKRSSRASKNASESQRTPAKRNNVSSSPTKNYSSPRQKSNITSRNKLVSSASTRNGNISPRKCPQREAAARHAFIKHKSIHLNSPKKISSTPSTSGSAIKGEQQNGHSRNKRQRRSNSTSEATDHDRSESSPAANSSHNLRKKRARIVCSSNDEDEENLENHDNSSSSNSSNHHDASSNSKVSPTSSKNVPKVNGRSSTSSGVKRLVKTEPLGEETRYGLRKKGPSSSPERNSGHNLRKRDPKRKVLQDADSDYELDDDDDEDDDEEYHDNPPNQVTPKGSKRNGSHPVPEDQEVGETDENENEESGENEVPPNGNIEDDEDSDIPMPVLRGKDEDYEYEDAEEEEEEEEPEEDGDDGSDYVDDESTPNNSKNSSQSQLRRSQRSKRANSKYEDDSDGSVGRPRRKANQRVTRRMGKPPTRKARIHDDDDEEEDEEEEDDDSDESEDMQPRNRNRKAGTTATTTTGRTTRNGGRSSRVKYAESEDTD